MSVKQLLGLGLVLFMGSTAFPLRAQDAQSQQSATGSGEPRGRRGERGEGPGQPLLGRIDAINSGALQLTRPDGSSVTVKLTDKTEFRKDRQAAKLVDFKVGDGVFVRAEQGADHAWTALTVAGRSGFGGEGGGREGGGGRAMFGELGKDFVVGEVKAVDAPKLTILRPDNVTQTLELTEDTSLHKGRESITMADIQPGDHVVARGAVENNVFVPKQVILLSPEQWQRMQEMGFARGANGGSAPGAPKSNPPQQPPR